MRDFLYAKMRGGHDKPAAAAAGRGRGDASLEAVVAALRQVSDDLRAVRAALERERTVAAVIESRPARCCLLRVPPEPHLPAGEPGSARVFRAAPNYWRLKLLQMERPAGVHPRRLRDLRDGPAVRPRTASTVVDKGGPRAVPVRRIMASCAAWRSSAVALWLVQLPITFALLRLDYELRWYIVTDRAARLREGSSPSTR